MNALLLGTALAIAAPALKDPPKTDPPIVGDWKLVEWLQHGTRMAFGDGTGVEFLPDGRRLWRDGPRDPEAFLRSFLRSVGAPDPPGRLTAALLQGARTLMVERPPWEAEIPLDELAVAPFPKLVVSGGHSAAFDAVCDVLEERLGALRAVLPGAGHGPQRLGEPFNELLASFVK